MPAAITVRTASVSDTDALVALIGVLGYTVAREDLPARLERFRGQGQGEVLVALQDENVVGFAALAVTFPIHAAQPVAHVSAFAVASGVRRQGVGRTLLAAVEQHARRAGCGRVMVGSAEQRADAHAFYVGSGWPYRGRRFGKVLDGA